MRAQRITIDTPDGPTNGIWQSRPKPTAVLAVAPGAGSDLDHPFMAGFAAAVAEAGIGVLRFNFLYKEAGRKAPDPPRKLESAWCAAFDAAVGKAKGAPVFAGGKSLGGRIASMCVADGMPAEGLVFLGYPLHPPGKPEKIRDAHLYEIDVPMLFLEGTRDPFATQGPLTKTLEKLGKRATLVEIEGGDHSFRTTGHARGEKPDDASIGAALAPDAIAFIRHAT